MTHRERFDLTVAHRAPDRPPFDLNGTTLTACHDDFLRDFIAWCGIRADSREAAEEALLQRYDVDFRRVGELFDPQSALRDDGALAKGEWIDGWGIRRKFTGLYWDIVGHPLRGATLEDLKAFPWPDAARIDRAAIEAHRQRAQRLYEETDYVVVGEHPVLGYLELGCWMFGFDDFLYRLLAEPEVAQWFFARYHRYVTDVCEMYYGRLGPFIHLTTSGDDFGTQQAPFLSPALFEESIAPWYKERIALTKEMTGALYFHHSCGSVFRLMDSIIAMGVDILNPIQPGAAEMEPERLKAACGDRLVFWGGIDEQRLLSRGTPESIREEVQRAAAVLGAGGGWVLAASHNIQPDVPPENVDAMLTALV